VCARENILNRVFQVHKVAYSSCVSSESTLSIRWEIILSRIQVIPKFNICSMVLQTQLARLTGLQLVGSERSSLGFNISMITASFQTNGSEFSLRRRSQKQIHSN
jgi:hypothetical protein